MASQPNFGLLGQNLNTNVNDTVMQALFGEQQRQQNQNVLDQQARADAVREAQGRMVMRAQPQQPIAGGDTADLEASFDRSLQNGSDEADLAIIAQADPAAAQQIIRQRRMRQDFAAVSADPTANNIARFGMAYPEALKGLKDAYDLMNAGQKQAAAKASADVYGYLKAGDGNGAIRILQQHMDAAQSTGEDVSAYPQMIEAIRQNPKAAQALAGINLSLAAPESFEKAYATIGDERRSDELQPDLVRKGKAEAGIKETEQRFAPQKAESELATAQAQRQKIAADIANDAARLALDRDKLELDRDALTSNIQLKLDEADRLGTQLSEGAKKEVGTAVGNAASSLALSDRAQGLADRFQASGVGGYGWGSSAREAFRGVFGQQDAITGLRNEYQQIVNQQAVKNLPPGPASDKDIQLAKQGFPPANASKEYIVSFLRGMAKMQQAVAGGEQRKADWISANGSLGTSRQDRDVGGVQVPAGTTFIEFDRNAVKRGRQGEAPAGIQSIISKYGGR